MAKKEKKPETAQITPGYKQSATKFCKLPHCMGNPKKLIEATSFEGKICEECFICHEWRPQESIDNQQKLEVKEEKIKKKTLTTDEAEIEKLIKEADKKDKKKVKTQNGEQSSLF